MLPFDCLLESWILGNLLEELLSTDLLERHIAPQPDGAGQIGEAFLAMTGKKLVLGDREGNVPLVGLSFLE